MVSRRHMFQFVCWSDWQITQFLVYQRFHIQFCIFLDSNAFQFHLETAPGLNGIPYKVYKKCPKISKFFFNIFQACFRRCKVPIQWWSAQEIYIPKVSSPSGNKLSDFRSIALWNVEGKLCFSLVSKCLEAHLIHNNKLINNSIQKSCIENIPGCWERLSMVWHALKEARPKSLI